MLQEEITQAATKNARILFVMDRPTSLVLRDVVKTITELNLGSEVQQVIRTTGLERVRFKNGGELIIRSPRHSSSRGFSVDVVVTDCLPDWERDLLTASADR